MGIFSTSHAMGELISQFISLNDAFIIIDVLFIIAVIEGVIILNLTERVGSLRKLFKLTASMAKNPINNTSHKETPTRNSPDN
jgi:hypothetical protein